MDIGKALGHAVTLINGAEGYADKAFLDTLAKPPVWTIGHGTTHILGERVCAGMTCTKQQADLWAMADMTAAAHFILATVKVALNEWELGALISLCYNIGEGHFAKSSVVEALNLGLYRVAADRFLEYDEAGGKELNGLKTRRGRERALFLVGLGSYVVQPRPCPGESEADILNEAELAKLNSHDRAAT